MSEIENHNGFYYPVNNQCPVIKKMLRDGVWERKIRAIFDAYVQPDWICVDVGTYIGMHTTYLASKSQYVIGFEAQPLIHNCLLKTLNAKGMGNTIVYNVALSNCKGSTTIKTNNNGDASLEGIRDHRFKWSYPVKKNTLDSYKIPRIDLMKIDIEGSEWDMLEGAIETIKRTRPIIILETFRRKSNKENIVTFCNRFDYNSQFISSDNYLLLPNP